jgi:ABC-type dipeptide/oligopeptide/nickel transport system ATPase component
MVDNHELERKAMELFKCGDAAKATALQDEFLKEILASGEDLCSCPSGCKFHGRCIECVMIHRGHGDHLPHCLQSFSPPS